MEKQTKAICPKCNNLLKVSSKFCTSCGAKLAGLDLKIISTEVQTQVSASQVDSTQLQFLDKEWEDLRQFVEQKNKGQIINLLSNFISRIPQSNNASRQKIYDLIGKTIKENPQFFKLYIYNKLTKKTKKILYPRFKRELEKYILQKYCFLKEEEMVVDSNGSFIFLNNAEEIKGRFFITNQRIIALGLHRAKTKKAVKRSAAGYGGIEFPYLGGIRLWRGLGHVDRMFPYDVITDRFSYSQTAIYLDQVNTEKEDKIDFNVRFEYEDRGKTKTISDNLKFIPKLEENENEMAFQSRREELFSKITEGISSILKKNKDL